MFSRCGRHLAGTFWRTSALSERMKRGEGVDSARPAAARSASTLAASVGASLSRASGATAISGNRKMRTACLWMLDARLKRLNTLFIFEIRWVLSILKIAFRAVACVEQARDVTGRVLAHCRTQPRASQSNKSSSQRPRASKAATANVVWRLCYVCAWAYCFQKSSAFVLCHF